MKHLFLVLVVGCLPFLVWSQRSIRVVDALTDQGLSDVSVTFYKADQPVKVALTVQENGRYTFPENTDIDSLRLDRTGFQPVTLGYFINRELPIKVSLLRLTQIPLPGLSVLAYAGNNQLNRVAAPVTKIVPRDFARFDNTSMQAAINTVPGVRMESRGAGGSRRISIRGSTLRSPFGVRNIKAYVNGAPISSPDGSTPLELIDVDHITGFEVIRGPASSLYGAGNGGVLLFENKPNRFQNHISVNALTGSDGLYRGTVSLSQGKGDLRTAIHYTRHRYTGYREQEHVQKDQLNWFVEKKVSAKQTVALFGNLFWGEWGLPGALDAEQVAEDPRQAVDFSVEADARVYRFRQWIALSHHYRFHERLSNYTVVTLNSTTKENPFGTSPFFNGYKDEQAAGAGVRSFFRWRPALSDLPLKLVWGIEAQTESNELDQFTNEQGEPGEPTLLSTTRSTEAFAFAQAEYALGQEWQLTAGSSLNLLHFDHEDRLAGPVDQSGTRWFDPVWSPRLSVLWNRNTTTLYAQLSMGFSPPTVWDVLQADGSVNTTLQPEIGRNAEVGWRGFYGQDRVQVDASAFYQLVDQSIIPEGLVDGSTVFRNAAQTIQTGVEARVSADVVGRMGTPGWGLTPWVSATIHDFEFQDYVVEGEDFSGNPMTGVPGEVVQAGLDVQHPTGAYARATLAYTGSIPLNDANSEQSDPSTVVNIRVGWQNFMEERSSTRWDVFVGINNALDEQYTSFFQWNGFGGRYFNPAPGRNWYVGLRWVPKWSIKPIKKD